jgi:glycosyltransferase 2 family protein
VNRHPGAVLGAAALVLATSTARRDPGGVEQRAFHLLNRDAGRAEGPIWVCMQMGNGLSAVAAPAALVLAGRRPTDAARVSIAAFGGWQLAKAVKGVIRRDRPNVLLSGVNLRDGDPGGRGFVSGHATVAMAVATATAPLVGRPARTALFAAAAVTAIARVHVGAHLPLDVVGGAGLGAVWGAFCSSSAGVR